MIAISPRNLLYLALLVFCPTAGLEIAHGAAQAPAASDGWHIPEGAAAEHNPEPLTPATLGKGQRLYRAKCERCHGVDGTGNGPETDPAHPAGDLTDARRGPPRRVSRWRGFLGPLWAAASRVLLTRGAQPKT